MLSCGLVQRTEHLPWSEECVKEILSPLLFNVVLNEVLEEVGALWQR